MSGRAPWRRRVYCRIHGKLDDVTAPVFGWLLGRVAPAGMRRRAWHAGYALGMGASTGGFLLQRMAEYDAGNLAAWDAREAARLDRRLALAAGSPGGAR